MKPLVSIIIPAYNAEKFIAETIQSALAQTWANKEIIVINNGSTDGTINVIKSFESLGIQIINQNNKGAATARNEGLGLAKGIYIQFLDADDLLSPDKIESQLNTLDGSLVDMAICKAAHFADGENYLNALPLNSWFDCDNNNTVDFLTKLYAGNDVMPGYGGMVPVHAWLSPRTLIDKAGNWNETLSVDDDGEFFCRVVLAANGIRYNDKALCYYRKFNNQNSLSSQKSRKHIKSSITAIDLKLSYLKAKTTNPIIDRIFAKHYWWTGVLAYPEFKDISQRCIQKGKQLGYAGEKYTGGPMGHQLTKLFGWKIARLVSHYKQVFKRSLAQ